MFIQLFILRENRVKRSSFVFSVVFRKRNPCFRSDCVFSFPQKVSAKNYTRLQKKDGEGGKEEEDVGREEGERKKDERRGKKSGQEGKGSKGRFGKQ